MGHGCEDFVSPTELNRTNISFSFHLVYFLISSKKLEFEAAAA